MKMRVEQVKSGLLFLRNFCAFFLLLSFTITCCMILFLNTMEQSMPLALSREGIRHAAILTFGNVALLSLLCAVLDGVRRKIMIERPVRQIVSAVEKIMQGDLNARIPPLALVDRMGGLDTIAEYFNRAAEELSGIEALRTDVIANVSHELKTPLAILQNYGILLRQRGLAEEKRLEYAQAVTDTAKQLGDLISNILKLNKLENQQIFPAKQTYNLGEQLCECLLAFESVWEKKNLQMEINIEQDVYVETDAELLSLVWNNLFSNAVKFTDPGGCISLSLKTEKEQAIVAVADTGCGISREVGRHMFEKFYQGDGSHSMQGNGLGLALVKRVVDIVGADISVDSEVGRGSVFTVKLRRKTDGTG